MVLSQFGPFLKGSRPSVLPPGASERLSERLAKILTCTVIAVASSLQPGIEAV
jgi:hypothetical protein